MIIKKFTDDWKWWIWTYVKSNNNKEDIFSVLLNHGFSWDLIAKELDFVPLRKSNTIRKERQKKLEEQVNYVTSLYKPLADNPRCARIESNYIELYEIDNFLTSQDCDKFIQYMDPYLMKSTVTNPDAEENVRTSSTAYIKNDGVFIENIDRQLHDFMRIPRDMAEEMQGQKYLPGQEFKPHCDWFDKNSEYNKVHLNKGQRTWTLMIYLNDVEEGGETKFTKIDIAVKPKKGKALVWYNKHPNNEPNQFTEHWGMPVIKGEKNIITKWFREHNGNQPGIQNQVVMPESP